MISVIAINRKYLYRRLLPYLGYSSCSRGFTGGCAVPLVLDFYDFRLISGSDLSDFNYRYGLTTVDQKDIGLFSNLTVYIFPLTINRLYSLS